MKKVWLRKETAISFINAFVYVGAIIYPTKESCQVSKYQDVLSVLSSFSTKKLL